MIELNLPAGLAPAEPAPSPWNRLRRLLRTASPAVPGATWAECRIDAAARAAWRDPVQFRREHLPPQSRGRRVLDEAARRSGWAGLPPQDVWRGVAMAEQDGTWVALVAEVSSARDVRRLVAAVDCGPVIDLDQARQDVTRGLRAGLQSAGIDPDAVRLDVAWVVSDVACTGREQAAAAAVAPVLANAWSALRAGRARERALQAAAG
jgi:isoquinoline 1-oxidoreductase beta subunit